MVSPHKQRSNTNDELKSVLSRAIFMRESQQAARCYEQLTEKNSDLILAPNLQYDLARLLELGNEPRLALIAYEQMLVNYQDDAMFAPSLRGAGHLSYRLKHFKKCRSYIEKFLDTNPGNAERMDAEALLQRLPDGKGVRKREDIRTPEPNLDNENEDSSSAILFHQPNDDSPASVPIEEEAQHDEGFERTPIAYHGDDIPPTDQLTLDEAQALASQHVEQEKKAENPANNKTQPEQEISGEVWAAELYGNGQSSTDTMLPYGDAAPPLENYDRFGETPPLSIGSRDIVKRAPKEARAPLPEGQEWGHDKALAPRFQHRPESSWGTPSPVGDSWKSDTAEYLRGREFAMLLPIGKRISLESAAEVLRIIEGIGDAEAKKAVLDRKGLLREKISYDEIIELYPTIRKCRKNFLFISIDPEQLPDVRFDVSKADFLEPGLRMRTGRGVKKARWENLRLISCGRLDRQPVIDLFCNKTCQHFRLRDPQFDFASVLDHPGSDANESCKRFLQMIVERCPEAVQSHTAKNLLSGKTYRPQKFSSEDEFRRYNTCLLLTHFGEPAQIKEIYEQSQAASR